MRVDVDMDVDVSRISCALSREENRTRGTKILYRQLDNCMEE